jgi:Bacterial cadherin-like domain
LRSRIGTQPRLHRHRYLPLTAYDGKADSVPALVTITVGDTVANFQPVAGWDRLATAANTPLTINREGLVSNDFDADSDELT